VIAVAAAHDASPPPGLCNKSPGARAFPRTIVDPAGRSPPLLLRLTAAGGKARERLEGNQATGNDADGGGFDHDLFDANVGRGCFNTWRANSFVTDNEEGAAAGPGAGCIQ
jgi:hypothetical protein